MPNKILSGADGVSKALANIAKRLGKGQAVKVGFASGATYPDGTPVAAVAFWNEFGNPKQSRPPRPFFRQMIAAEAPGWPETLAKAIVHTNYDGPKALALMGESIGDALAESINELTTPELAESTVEAKGFSKPLIDTGVMQRAITYQVDDGDRVPIEV